MDKAQKAAAIKEWAQILKDHPNFARAFIAQQAMLIEASELGNRLIDMYMCKLIGLGMVVPFQEFWESRCKNLIPVRPGGVLDCLARAADPADCMVVPHEDEWFDDPFAKGGTLPPIGPVPSLRKPKS
jgi:hypothetical protein